jgi:pimeloyl-ACP methyl ester carboxylesterase
MFLAGLAGVVTGGAVVGVIEAVGHMVYAPATPADLSTREAMAAFVRTLPVGAFLFVLAAYVAGTAAGGYIATLVARRHAARFAWVVGSLILVGAVVNFFAIPHPAWFVVATMVAVPLAAFLTGRAGQALEPA